MIGLASAGFDSKGAVVLFNQSAADPESEAGSEVLLGGEKGFEEVAKVLLRNTCSPIRDANAHIVAARLEFNSNLPVGAAGVDGVCDQIGHDLADFARHDAGDSSGVDI